MLWWWVTVNTPFGCGRLTTVATWAISVSRCESSAKLETYMHDTVRKSIEMGGGHLLSTEKPPHWQRKFGPRQAKLWKFPNLSGQIRELCVVTGIDLVENQ